MYGRAHVCVFPRECIFTQMLAIVYSTRLRKCAATFLIHLVAFYVPLFSRLFGSTIKISPHIRYSTSNFRLSAFPCQLTDVTCQICPLHRKKSSLMHAYLVLFSIYSRFVCAQSKSSKFDMHRHVKPSSFTSLARDVDAG